MNKNFFTLFFFAIILVIVFKGPQKPKFDKRPPLVIGIVVDQMRQEYLYRFYPYFSKGGFKHLVEEGFAFHNVHYNYIPTYTAPGHASIYTGTTPAIHGILANDWYDKKSKKYVYCTKDKGVFSIGIPNKEKEGQMSPRNLKVTTITDELALAMNFKSKIISLSLKDRAAILPGGHLTNGAYWMSDNGNFISSSFYLNQLPKWVSDFNDKKDFSKYASWELKERDKNYKEDLKGLEKTNFPYNFEEKLKSENFSWIKETPFGNKILFDFAKKAIEAENLGKNQSTDFLTLSFSSTDYVGHEHGPRSLEVKDTYLRLDKDLEDFLLFLDKKLGKNKYLLFLTADHAVGETVEYLQKNKFSASYLTGKELHKRLKEFSIKKYNENLAESCFNQNVFLNQKLIQKKGLKKAKVLEAFKNEIYSYSEVMKVYKKEDLPFYSPSDFYAQMALRGTDFKKSGDLILFLQSGFDEWEGIENYRASHFSGFNYDTHVPLLWYGWGIKEGKSHKRKVITQIAPSLSQKLKIPFPSASNTEILEELFDKEE